MGTLTGMTLATALMVGSAAAADPIDVWRPYVAEASSRFGVPPAWIERVVRVESGGHTTLSGRPIRSRAGAIGLMQLMPPTWTDMRDTYGLGADPDDPRNNILAGTAYLRAMYDRFGYPGLFLAYNAGPARYADHLATGKTLPAETIAYLASVTDGGSTVRKSESRRHGDGLFFPLRAASVAAAAAGDVASLFVSLTRR